MVVEAKLAGQRDHAARAAGAQQDANGDGVHGIGQRLGHGHFAMIDALIIPRMVAAEIKRRIEHLVIR